MLESPSVAQGHKLLIPRPRTQWQTLTLCPYSEDSDGGLPAGATSLEISSKPVADCSWSSSEQHSGSAALRVPSSWAPVWFLYSPYLFSA